MDSLMNAPDETASDRAAKTLFATELKHLIVDETNKMMAHIDVLAQRHGVSDTEEIGMLVDRYGGDDLGGVWDDFVAENR